MSRWRKLFRSSNAENLPTADVMKFEPLARPRLSQMAYDYVRSGGADEISMRENRAGFGRLKLAPSVLVDVSQIDTRVNLFGGEFESPILLAPVAYHRLYHAEGEIGTARGANAAGAGFVVSTFTTTSIDEMTRNTQSSNLVPALRPTRPGIHKRHGAARGGVRVQGRLPDGGYASAGQPLWPVVIWVTQPSGVRAFAWDGPRLFGAGTQDAAQNNLRHVV